MRNTSFPFSKTSKLPAGAADRAWSSAAGADADGEDAGTAAGVEISPPGWAAAFTLDTIASEFVAPDAAVAGRTAGRRIVVLVEPVCGGPVRSTTSTTMSTVQARTAAPKTHPRTSNRRPGPELTKPGLTTSAGSGSSAVGTGTGTGTGTGMDVVSQLNRGLSGSKSAAGTPSTELHTGSSIRLSISAPAELSTAFPTRPP